MRSKTFNATLRLNPRAAAAQVELSRLELAGGHLDKLHTVCRTAHSKKSASAVRCTARAGRGLDRQTGCPAAARERAPDIGPRSPIMPRFRRSRDRVRAMKGDRSGAARTLARALELDPATSRR